MDCYKEIRFVGKGSYGQCHLVQNRTTGRYFIMKRISLGVGAQVAQEIRNEASILQKVGQGHPNICQYEASFINNGEFCIVMPYYKGGDMQRMIRFRQTNGKPFTSETILDYVLQMCLGLAHIHKKNVIHRDIKPSNIFVTRANVLKIGDFGISKSLQRADDLTQTNVGTPYYISPEKLRGKPYGSKSDMWALGCLVYELCTFTPPFRGRDMNSLSANILRSKTPRVPTKYGKFIDVLVRALLQKDPEKRPSAERLLRTRAMQSRLMFHSTRFQKKVSIAQNPKTKAKAAPSRAVPYRFGNARSPSANSRKPPLSTPSPERRVKRWAQPRDALHKNPQTARPKPDTPRSKPQTPTRVWQHGTPSTDESQAVIQRMRQHIAPDRKLGSGEQNPESPLCADGVRIERKHAVEHKRPEAKQTPRSRLTKGNPEAANRRYGDLIASKIRQRMIGLEKLLTPAEMYISLGYLRQFAAPQGDRTQPSRDSMKVEIVEKFFLEWHADWTWDMKWECAAEIVDIISLEAKLLKTVA